MTAFFVLCGLLGILAAARLAITLLPSLEYPSLVVWTTYPDVAPERVERAVTERIEEAVAGTPGLVRITSRSQLGGSLVRIELGWNSDLELAALGIRQQLDRLAGVLPETAERPVVLRVDPSDRPIVVVAVYAEGLANSASEDEGLVALKEIAKDVVARRLEQIDGVARVRVTGGFDREVEVIVSPEKLAIYDLSLDDLVHALETSNVSLVGGTIRRGPFRYTVEVSGEFRHLADVAATVISRPGHPPLLLSEVAHIQEGLAQRQGLVRLDGRETLVLLVERRPDSNTVETAAAVRQALEVQREELPGIGTSIVIDESRFIGAAIGGVVRSIVFGGMLAVLVLLFFLRHPRTLLAVGITVPLTLAVTLVFFELLGVSLNLISLSGLALGVGMLVDNAIVVVENIARLRDQGLAPRVAARQGTAGVAMAITASTLTTMAVFLPLTYVEGLAGRLFRDQSLAVVCSLSASLLVALTVVPLIASRESEVPERASGPAPTGWIGLYEKLLASCLRHPGRVLGLTTGFFIATALLSWQLPREVLAASSHQRLEAQLELAPSADLSAVEARSEEIERQIAGWPGVRQVLADLGERDAARLEVDPRPPYRGDLTVMLSSPEVADEVLRRLARLPLPAGVGLEARRVSSRLESLLVGDGPDLRIDLTAEDRDAAEETAARLLAELGRRPEVVYAGRAHPENIPGIRIDLDREAMARYGAQPRALGAVLEAVSRGREATRLQTTNDQIPIVLHNRKVDSVETLLAQRLPVSEGRLPLSTFVEAKRVSLPAVRMRDAQAPVVRLHAEIAPEFDLRAALGAVDEALELTLPVGVRGRVSGANEAFLAGLRSVTTSLLLSVLLVYLILAAQFESLTQPLVILSVVPLAAGGAALALALAGQSWNLMSLTGCVVLVGIAVNDAIVKVDFINQRRRDGAALDDALRAAGRDRLRPILITTSTTAVGLLPLALGAGTGADLRAPLAIAIIGGLLSTTLLTLTALPVLYQRIVGWSESRLPRALTPSPTLTPLRETDP